jgi:subtilase family serine protease
VGTAVVATAALGNVHPPASSATSLSPPEATVQGLQQVETPQVAANRLGYSLTRSSTEPYVVCGPPTPGHFGCASITVPPGAARKLSPLGGVSEISPAYEGSGEEGGFSPSDLRSAYKLSSTGGSGQTVAIVDAYNDPKAEADLAVYRTKYGLPACTRANGCFKKVNQKGESSENEEAGLYPSSKYPINELTGEVENWGLEISLDMDMVSAACQECKILLVEATNNVQNEKKEYNLYIAENEAATLKATEISNSWDGEERSEEASEDKDFEHPGIPITVASGDSGYGVQYPAASKDVIAVGGTTRVVGEGLEGQRQRL